MFVDLTPEERAEQIEMFTDMTFWNGRHGYYRYAGVVDGRNKWTPMVVPAVDAKYQADYNAGYSDGLYWSNRMTATTM